jgi:class 3 adenylate cyclase
MIPVEWEIALATERVERRLTAILAADVAGYSRLTGMDEEGTHARLQDHLRSLVDPEVATPGAYRQEHRGWAAGGIQQRCGRGALRS